MSEQVLLLALKLSDNIRRLISEKKKSVDNLMVTIASGQVSGAALSYINENLNKTLAEVSELEQKLSADDTDSVVHGTLSSVKDITEALDYLRARFDDISIEQRRGLVRRIVDRVVWNGENLDIFGFGT